MEQRFDSSFIYQFTDQRIDPDDLPLRLAVFSQAVFTNSNAFSCPHDNRETPSALSTSVQVEIPTERDGNPMQAAIIKNLKTVPQQINLCKHQMPQWRRQKIE